MTDATPTSHRKLHKIMSKFYRITSSQIEAAAPSTDVFQTWEAALAAMAEARANNAPRHVLAALDAKLTRTYLAIAGNRPGDVPTSTFMQANVPFSAWDPATRQFKEGAEARVSTDHMDFAKPDEAAPADIPTIPQGLVRAAFDASGNRIAVSENMGKQTFYLKAPVGNDDGHGGKPQE